MDTIIITPLVSVIMPAYNATDYIQEAIDSVISQTFSNWELIIIDDGSTDTTAEIVAKNINKDNRIKCFYQQNQKQSKARNFGISQARGTYIAFLDADDICFPERFAKQVAFLEANHDVVVCGSWFSIIGSDRIIKLAEHHDAIKLALLRGNCIAHSSVMTRKQTLNEFPLVFEASKEPAEDYDLWVRLITKGRLHNLQEVLLDYRTHSNQLSKKQNIKQKQSALETKQSLFNFLELELLPGERLVLNKVINNGEGICFNDIGVFQKLQMKLLVSNTSNFFEPIGFKKEMLDLEKIVVKRCFITKRAYLPKTYLEYFKVKQQLRFKLTIWQEFKLAIKALFFFQSEADWNSNSWSTKF